MGGFSGINGPERRQVEAARAGWVAESKGRGDRVEENGWQSRRERMAAINSFVNAGFS